MILTAENYYSQEANQEYLSVSQYKTFCGTYGRPACEARAIAELRGEWEQPTSVSMMVGSYVDAHFEGTLDIFRAKHPEIFTQKGALRAEYKKAEEIIARIERDPLFMKYMSGRKQVIMTGEIGGAKWKIKIDSLVDGICIVDLKIMKALRDVFRTHDAEYMGFVEFWGYDQQGAVYQEIVRQNTGQILPFYIAAASKESETDIEIIQIDDAHLQQCLMEIESNVPKVLNLKNGVYQPIRCETCDYCKHTKILTAPIHYTDLIPGLNMQGIITKYNENCMLCGRPTTTQHHFIFGWGMRSLAEEDGIKGPICDRCHNMADNLSDRIHDNPAAEKLSKMLGQLAWEKRKVAEGMTEDEAREAFRKRYKRSWL